MTTTTLYFYTGTGNSLWTARKIAGFLDHSQVVSLKHSGGDSAACKSECIGFIFPVHIWGVPPPVLEFLRRLQVDRNSYLFAVAVNAGQVAATLIQLQNFLQARNLRLSSGFSIDLPSNYIPWGQALSPDKQQVKFAAALKKIERIARAVRKREDLPPEKGFFLQNWFFSLIYRKSLPYVGGMDKPFFADEKCNACGTCAKVCPAQNILMAEGRPSWQRHCEQCFACIQWCPQESIQYGKNTKHKKRYRHPDILLKDIIACAPQMKE